MLIIKAKEMDKKIKMYEIGEDSELLAISLVESPAVETSFVALQKENQTQYIALEKSDKHIVYGCALRANFPIYRYDGENEYYIKFSPKAIEKMSRDYLIKKNDNWTLDHNQDTDGISIIESWIKEDEKLDKSIALGLEDVEVGSWFIGAYVDNEETWQTIKSGKWTGFSIEGMCQLDEIKLQKENNMKKENLEQIEVNDSFWDKIKSIIKDALTIPQVEEPEAEQVAEETVEEVKDEVIDEPAKEEVEEPVEMADEPVEEPKADETNKDEEIENLKAEIEALKKENEELKAKLAEKEGEVEKLSKQPSAKPVKVEAKKENEISFLDFAAGNVKF